VANEAAEVKQAAEVKARAVVVGRGGSVALGVEVEGEVTEVTYPPFVVAQKKIQVCNLSCGLAGTKEWLRFPGRQRRRRSVGRCASGAERKKGTAGRSSGRAVRGVIVWMARARNLRVSVRAPPTLQRALLRPRCRGCAAVWQHRQETRTDVTGKL
jgi:hypothetical protein